MVDYQKPWRGSLNASIGIALVLFLVLALPLRVTAQPTAQSILEKSQAAMGPPIQYRILTDGVEVSVSQKLLSDGSLAMRTETSSPFKKVTFLLGDESYEIYPDKNVVIDTGFMLQAAKSQAASISSALGNKATTSASIKGTIVRDGKECFIVEAAISPEVTTMLGKTLPGATRNMLPSTTRLVIEKETYTLVEMESISRTGSSLSKLHFVDVVRQPNLPDELFLPPDAREMKKPKSMAEYIAIITEMFRVKPPDEPPKIEVPPLPPRPQLGPIEIDPDTGLAIPPTPPGMSQEEWERRIGWPEFKRRVAERKVHRESTEPKPYTSTRKMGIYGTLALIVVLSIAIALRRWMNVSPNRR